MFTQKDIEQIKHHGLDVETVKQQIENFIKGFPFAKIEKPASINDGILKFTDEETDNIASAYDEKIKDKTIVKFVPASGAASRMFKEYFAFTEKNQKLDENKQVEDFFNNISKFAFYEDLKSILDEQNIEINEQNIHKIVDILIDKNGLNYGHLPKALIKFHKYSDSEYTSLEEHLFEASQYAKNNKQEANLIFTVSPEHRSLFNNKINSIKHVFETKYNTGFSIKLTEQKPSTDMIAVDENNNVFRNSDGSLLFRPGGHGALIENLNEISADLVFIKNIDNVIHQDYASDVMKYKKLLASVLLDIQNEVFSYLRLIDENKANIKEIEEFTGKKLQIVLPEKYSNFNNEEKLNYLKQKLNRPLRVCGMVKNEGEPGGGPFWVKHIDDSLQLQIVESAEIDKNDPKAQNILQSSTHFNPVDIVCSLRNYKGEKFDLSKFVNKNAGFISNKSKDGKTLKAQELPGLWNGAMYDWNTIFVEIPVITFNPVKILNDLLRKYHLQKV